MGRLGRCRRWRDPVARGGPPPDRRGIAYERDGIHYLVVEKVVEDEGIVNLSHEDYGVTPPFAFPDPTE